MEGSFPVIFGCSGGALAGFGHLGPPEAPGGRPEARKSGLRAAGRSAEASAGVGRVWWGAARCGEGQFGSFLAVLQVFHRVLAGFGHFWPPESPGVRSEACFSGPGVAGRCTEANAGGGWSGWGSMGRAGGRFGRFSSDRLWRVRGTLDPRNRQERGLRRVLRVLEWEVGVLRQTGVISRSDNVVRGLLVWYLCPFWSVVLGVSHRCGSVDQERSMVHSATCNWVVCSEGFHTTHLGLRGVLGGSLDTAEHRVIGPDSEISAPP